MLQRFDSTAPARVTGIAATEGKLVGGIGVNSALNLKISTEGGGQTIDTMFTRQHDK